MEWQLCFLKDEYFKKFPNHGLMEVKKFKKGDAQTQSRPFFFAFPDSPNKDIIWLVPISSQYDKFKKVYDKSWWSKDAPYGWEVIADNNRVYPNLMGGEGRSQLGELVDVHTKEILDMLVEKERAGTLDYHDVLSAADELETLHSYFENYNKYFDKDLHYFDEDESGSACFPYYRDTGDYLQAISFYYDRDTLKVTSLEIDYELFGLEPPESNELAVCLDVRYRDGVPITSTVTVGNEYSIYNLHTGQNEEDKWMVSFPEYWNSDGTSRHVIEFVDDGKGGLTQEATALSNSINTALNKLDDGVRNPSFALDASEPLDFNVTAVKCVPVRDAENPVKALIDIEIGNALRVNYVKVVQEKSGELRVLLPTHKHAMLFNPLNQKMADKIQDAVIDIYGEREKMMEQITKLADTKNAIYTHSKKRNATSQEI